MLNIVNKVRQMFTVVVEVLGAPFVQIHALTNLKT